MKLSGLVRFVDSLSLLFRHLKQLQTSSRTFRDDIAQTSERVSHAPCELLLSSTTHAR